MDSLMTTGISILEFFQKFGILGTAFAFCIGGYFLIFGGDRGRSKAVGWFVGGAIGLIVVMGAYTLAETLDSNVQF